jgi:hypothetical protein
MWERCKNTEKWNRDLSINNIPTLPPPFMRSNMVSKIIVIIYVNLKFSFVICHGHENENEHVFGNRKFIMKMYWNNYKFIF